MTGIDEIKKLLNSDERRTTDVLEEAVVYIRRMQQATADAINSKDATAAVSALNREISQLQVENEFLKRQLGIERVVPIALFPKHLVDASTQCDVDP